MARTAITVARRHGTGTFEILAGPSVPLVKQRAEFKQAKAVRKHPKFAEVALWDSSSGIVSRIKFQLPAGALPSGDPEPLENPHPPSVELDEALARIVALEDQLVEWGVTPYGKPVTAPAPANPEHPAQEPVEPLPATPVIEPEGSVTTDDADGPTLVAPVSQPSKADKKNR